MLIFNKEFSASENLVFEYQGLKGTCLRPAGAEKFSRDEGPAAGEDRPISRGRRPCRNLPQAPEFLGNIPRIHSRCNQEVSFFPKTKTYLIIITSLSAVHPGIVGCDCSKL